MHVLCSLRVYCWVLIFFFWLSHQWFCMQRLTQMRCSICVFYRVLFVHVLFELCQRRVLFSKGYKPSNPEVWRASFSPRRASLKMKTEKNTSTRSRSSLRCLRSLRGSWSCTLTSSARRTSRSSRTLARWGRVCVCCDLTGSGIEPWQLCNGPRRTCTRRFVVQSSGMAFWNVTVTKQRARASLQMIDSGWKLAN